MSLAACPSFILKEVWHLQQCLDMLHGCLPDLESILLSCLLLEASCFLNLMFCAGTVGALAATELGRSMATGIAQRATTYWSASRAGRGAAGGPAGATAAQGASTVHVSEAPAVAGSTAGTAWSISSWWAGSASEQPESGEQGGNAGRGRGGRGRSPRGRGRGRRGGRGAEM